eukprot:CAMPEP_0115308262 /NCGR_PEP_ID=MMETSP0270-20121206/73604_1 /TAXON_ID=71861 /ORGANISM="Scrippsiella trochoidea, Strain CCMP3099" /LENGTH=334 /DNA_ID=CAMNT_0002726807 /DNA_START=148 /DNA_END=1151 /DNA_ORIENTATION=-
MECLEQLLGFLREAGNVTAVGILDATNTTVERRAKVLDRCSQERGVTVLFLESLCTDESVLEANYKLKLINDDYKGMDAGEATKDFLERVAKYEEAYQPLDDVEQDRNMSYIKLIDAGRKLVKYGATQMLVRPCPDTSSTCCTASISGLGQSSWHSLASVDMTWILGADGGGAEAGPATVPVPRRAEAEAGEEGQPAMVMCGTLQRHLHTARYLKLAASFTPHKTRVVLKLQRLNELCVGGLDGMSEEEVERDHPDEAAARRRDKLNYRYPGEGGESYQDLVLRIHENILRLEQLRGSAMVLCDRGVMRVLLAYFRGTPISDMPSIEVPPGVVQ